MIHLFFKLLLIALLGSSLYAGIHKVTGSYVQVQTTDTFYVGNDTDQTYSLNPSLFR